MNGSGVSSQNVSIGRDGESVAANWYLRAGFTIEARNWRCREGELDVIALRTDSVSGRATGLPLLVVCEVKTRSSARFGSGAESVGPQKQRRLRLATSRYLHQRDGGPCRVRFDVAVVDRGPHGYAIRVIEGAF